MTEAFGSAVMPDKSLADVQAPVIVQLTKGNVVETFAAVLLGVGCGIALLAIAFRVGFRRKATEIGPRRSVQNHDVFDRDPSFYSPLDKDHGD